MHYPQPPAPQPPHSPHSFFYTTHTPLYTRRTHTFLQMHTHGQKSKRKKKRGDRKTNTTVKTKRKKVSCHLLNKFRVQDFIRCFKFVDIKIDLSNRINSSL